MCVSVHDYRDQGKTMSVLLCYCLPCYLETEPLTELRACGFSIGMAHMLPQSPSTSPQKWRFRYAQPCQPHKIEIRRVQSNSFTHWATSSTQHSILKRDFRKKKKKRNLSYKKWKTLLDQGFLMLVPKQPLGPNHSSLRGLLVQYLGSSWPLPCQPHTQAHLCDVIVSPDSARNLGTLG